MIADDPDCKIDLKSFHCSIVNDHEALKKEQDNYKDIGYTQAGQCYDAA